MRERSPGHASDSRVVRDYDQEEAGFESNGDIKVRYIRNEDRGSAVVDQKYEYLIPIKYFGSIRFRTILTMESQKMGNYQHYKKILEVRQWVQKIWKYQTLRSFCIKYCLEIQEYQKILPHILSLLFQIEIHVTNT